MACTISRTFNNYILLDKNHKYTWQILVTLSFIDMEIVITSKDTRIHKTALARPQLKKANETQGYSFTDVIREKRTISWVLIGRSIAYSLLWTVIDNVV